MQYASPSLRSSEKAASLPSAFDNAPPFNLEAEQGFLGALLLWNNLIEDAPFLSGADFFDALHERIFESIVDCVKAGRRADPTTLKTMFASAEPIRADLTVPQYLVQLVTEHACVAVSAKAYAHTIADLSARRQLMIIGEDLALVAREAAVDVAPSILIEETEARLFSLAQHTTAELSTTVSFGEAATEAVVTAEAVAGGKIVGLRTGLSDLDAKIVGPNPSDLVILAGRPSMGKTALAVNIAFHVARSGQGAVHFFSLEMSAEQLAMRVLGEQIEVSASKLRSGKASPPQMASLRDRAGMLSGVPLFIDQLGGASIAQVTARARRLKRKHDTKLIVVDYIQLMQPGARRRENRVQDVSEITTGLKALAKELQVPILALSQLSRNVEHRDNKRPQLPDLRESGSIEQDADIVMFVFREEYYVERDEPSVSEPSAYADWQEKMRVVAGKAEIIIGKQRHGELGNVQVAFSGEFTRFSNLARQEVRHA